MAEVIGISGAWNDIARELSGRGLKVVQPADIAALIPQLRANFSSSVEKKKAEAAGRIKALENRIAALQGEKGFFIAILNSFIVFKCRLDISRIPPETQRYIAGLEENIERLESLQNSPELAGAQTEISAIAQLARLPADCTVFNDVRLRANRYIHFNGAALQSAQLDHLVLSPAGLFVIETKVWSKNFVETGEYHDPYDQVQRASYLCYDTVKAFGKVHVRSVIACAGHLPPKPADAKIKVLHVDELSGYISWFKDKDVKPELLSDLKVFFGHHVGALDRFGGISAVADVFLVKKRDKTSSGVGAAGFLSIICFISSYFVRHIHIGGYFHFEGVFSLIFFAAGCLFSLLAVFGYLKSKLEKHAANKVAKATGIHLGGYRLRRKFDLIRSIISLIAALLPFAASKYRREMNEEQSAGVPPTPTEPYKRRATLIPTEPPPLTKKEIDRKYMPPAMRAELESKDKPFSDVNPICPYCNKHMVLRALPQGSAQSSKFWGCPNHPACQYTMQFGGSV